VFVSMRITDWLELGGVTGGDKALATRRLYIPDPQC
jgi:hypothetical protein